MLSDMLPDCFARRIAQSVRKNRGNNIIHGKRSILIVGVLVMEQSSTEPNSFRHRQRRVGDGVMRTEKEDGFKYGGFDHRIKVS